MKKQKNLSNVLLSSIEISSFLISGFFIARKDLLFAGAMILNGLIFAVLSGEEIKKEAIKK
jgi:hypothetical protein